MTERLAMADNVKTVWILGSGFSAGLGGPLLNELLSPSGKSKMLSKYDSVRDEVGIVYDTYWRHHPELRKEVGNPGAIYWRHAEEFLDFIDEAATRSGPRTTEFEGLGTKLPAKEFHKRAVRAVAAECLFTEPMNLSPESWQPYRSWANGLTSNDSIVTFNYDLVLERSYADNGTTPHVVVMPGKPRLDGYTNIYKLHGSVNWRSINDGDDVEVRNAGDILTDKQMPLIATPGPSKRLHAAGLLASIWKLALETIRNADIIVFIGYRFPPSDSEARRTILQAIRQSKRQELMLHTGLGPRTSDDDTIRLKAMLEAVLQASRSRADEGMSWGGDEYPPWLYYVQSHNSHLSRALGAAPLPYRGMARCLRSGPYRQGRRLQGATRAARL
jgi:hypothetical protein